MAQSLSHQFTQSPASVGQGTTSVTIRLRITYHSSLAVVDSVNNFTVTGNWPTRSNANVPINVGNGGSQVIYDETITVSTSLAGAVQRSFSASLSGIEFWGTGQVIRTSGTHTVPQRPPSPPSTPNMPTVSNITSSSFRVNRNGTPASNGAAITSYGFQVALDAGFASGVVTQTGNVASMDFPGRTPNTTYYVRVRAFNSAGWGPWSSARQVSTTVAAPAAPSNVRVARGGADNSHTPLWTHNGSSQAPYASQRIERQVDTNGTWSGWATIATVGVTATSYTDTTTVTNREYRYRVVAVNAGGSSVSSPSDYIRTTPGAPFNLQAVKTGGDIRVIGDGNAAAAASSSDFRYEWQDNPGGTGWVSVGSATTGHMPDLTHSSPNPSVTHQYRARARVSSGTSNNQTIYSAWSTPSNVVQLQAPPNAPTPLAPSSGAHDRDAVTLLQWQHNPVDTTVQEAYELRWRRDGGAWTTLTGTTAQSRSVNLGGLSGQIEWQVRTRGAHATFSPWSAIGAFTLAAKPTATIAYPEPGEYDSSQINVAWTYFSADSSPQAQWQAQIRDDSDVVIENRAGSTSGNLAGMSTILADQTTYVIAVRLRSASGLWSDWDLVEIATDFPLPQRVEITPTWDRETGSISLGLTPLDPVGDEMPVEHVTIQRRIDRGEWVTLATDILPDDTVTDHLPIIGGVNEYRAISWTSLPSSQASDINEPEPWHHYRCSTYINTGDGFTEVGTLRGHQATDTPSIEAVGHHFAGRAKPVAFFGDAEDLSVGFTGTIWDDTTSRAEWMRLLRLKQLACYRDCQGRRHFGIFGVTFTQGSGVQQATLSLMEMDHTEGIEVEAEDLVEVDE